jgi:hypothetical protein
MFVSMKLMYPEFLWALLLLAIPIALHLFHLRRFKVFYFSNVSFLKQLDTTSKSTRKLKEWLILLMRLLALIFAIFAFAQPYVPKNELSSDQLGITTFVIDNSYSMSAQGVQGNLLSEAKDVVRNAINRAKPGHRFLLITSARTAEEARVKNKLDALDYLDEITFSGQTVTSDEYLKFLKRVYKDLQINPQTILLSDGQKNQWLPLERNELTGTVTFLKLTPANQENVAIDSIWTDRPLLKPNAPFELSVRIRNKGTAALTGIPVTISVGENTQRFTANFDAEGTAILRASYLSPEVGHHAIRVEIQDEQLLFDDEFFGAFTIGKNLKVGLVNEVTAGKQLEILYGLDSYYQVQAWSVNQVPVAQLQEMDLVVLNQLNDLSPALEQALIDHIDKGKSVVFIPGKEANLSTWNRVLENQQMPQLVKTDTSGVFISEIHHADRFFQGVFESSNPTIRIPVQRRHKLELRTARAIPLLTYSDQSPFLVRSSNNSKQVYLFNSDMAGTSSVLMNSDIVSALFLRMGELAGANKPLFFQIGQSGQLLFSSEQAKDVPLVLAMETGEFIPRQIASDRQIMMYLDDTENEWMTAGVFDVLHGKQTIGKVALNFNRSESTLEFASETELKEAYKLAGITQFDVVMTNFESYSAGIGKDQVQTYWRILLILAFVCLLAELLIIRLWKV